jgi:hypothetical protein
MGRILLYYLLRRRRCRFPVQKVRSNQSFCRLRRAGGPGGGEETNLCIGNFISEKYWFHWVSSTKYTKCDVTNITRT